MSRLAREPSVGEDGREVVEPVHVAWGQFDSREIPGEPPGLQATRVGKSFVKVGLGEKA